MIGRSNARESGKRRWLVPAGALVLGVVAGFAGKRVVEHGGSTEAGELQETRLETKSAREIAAVPLSTLRSTDTIDQIVNDTSAQQYGRLALWVLDADSLQLAEMFRRMQAQDGVERRVLNVLMVRWAEVDPWAAIEAARGSRQELTAWWAWGKCDPARALAAAAREQPRWLGVVMRGAGQSHPDLALDLLDRYPELAHHYTAIEGIAEGLQQRDPREAIEFARRHGQEDSDRIREWARRDPEDFLRWCAEQPVTRGLSDHLERGLETLVSEHPERIEKLLAALPPGQLRREFLQTAVEGLAARDLDRALALVGRESSGWVQSGLYGLVGTTLAEADVARSMELFREFGHLRRAGGESSTVYPNGGSSGGGSGTFQEWVRKLATKRPEETMALVREVDGASALESSVAQSWLAVDATGFAEWLLDEPRGLARDAHISHLADHLLAEEHPDLVSAAEWAASVETGNIRDYTMERVIRQGWQRNTTAAEAERYFQSEETPPAVREAWERWCAMNPGNWRSWQATDEQP